MAQRLRIFISSPGDVPDERLRADLIVDKLGQDYGKSPSKAIGGNTSRCLHPAISRMR